MKKGIYETIINKELNEKLENIDDNLKIQKSSLNSDGEAKLLSTFLKEKIDHALESKKLDKQITLVNKILKTLELNEDVEIPQEKPKELLAIYPRIYDKNPIRPITPISSSTLFTGTNGPSLESELTKEIESADSIDFLVSFIKWTGLLILLPALKRAVGRNTKLRIISTSYLGATDPRAIDVLSQLPNTEIKISYDTKRTRLHAKTYIFKRNSGYTTAYIGSSNISHAALASGLEWNLKISQKELPDTISQIENTFESYWEQKDFELYKESEKERLETAINAEKGKNNKGLNNNDIFYAFEIQPYSYQQEILDDINFERNVNHHNNNLVVAATGTGKTIIAAIDYREWKKDKPSSNLLFIAHREEILKQSLGAFRAVLKDNNFGSLIVGQYKSNDLSHLFISIQSANSKDLIKEVAPDYYDYIIVDEFHHASASSYKSILDYFKPKALLGLTATPERMDGADILSYFDGRIASELRLPEAIDRKLLCPFLYFGISDPTDLSHVKWTKGGYDENELSNLFTIDQAYANKRADLIINSTAHYVTDLNDVIGLGFCVSIEHAEFMAQKFNERGIPSAALTSKTDDSTDRDKKIRETITSDLINKKIHFIFTVDMFNEGVDIPQINTILFLRPTKSLTIFLQQLGRGLRLHDDKNVLTVLDFIGLANNNYDFEEKFRALMKDKKTPMKKVIETNFSSLPAGCYIQLEEKAQEDILKNIKHTLTNQKAIKEKIKYFEFDTGKALSLRNFLDHYPGALKTIYKKTTFSTLQKQLGLIDYTDEAFEKKIRAGLYKLACIDSKKFLEFLIRALTDKIDTNNNNDQLMLDMLTYSLFEHKVVADKEPDYVINELNKRTYLKDELLELFTWLNDHIDFISQPANLPYDCPLEVYCSYSKNQILKAFGYAGNPNAMREGVNWFKQKKTDVFLVTLDKSKDNFSSTTMYNDYAINEHLFHWQSQNDTSHNSDTGIRYINHKKLNNNILLFAREFVNEQDTGETSNYTFLGRCFYVDSNGDKPMNIRWRLEYPIPARMIRKINKMIII